MSYFVLDGHALPDPPPDGFLPRPFEIGEDKRLANGRMITDIVTIKWRFTLSYPFLKWDYLQYITDVFEASDYVVFQYPYGGVEDNQKTVKITDIGGFPLQYIEVAPGDWQYKDITITMEEQ